MGLGRLSIIDYIISKNSKTVNIRDKDGRTALHYAFVAPPKYITSIYDRLIKAGANENLIDKVCFFSIIGINTFIYSVVQTILFLLDEYISLFSTSIISFLLCMKLKFVY